MSKDYPLQYHCSVYQVADWAKRNILNGVVIDIFMNSRLVFDCRKFLNEAAEKFKIYHVWVTRHRVIPFRVYLRVLTEWALNAERSRTQMRVAIRSQYIQFSTNSSMYLMENVGSID